MTEEEKSQSPETPRSTEEETEAISEERMAEAKDSLQFLAEASEGELASTLEKQLTNLKPEDLGALAPVDSDMATSLQHEGISPPFLARKLKILLESVEPKWNLSLKKWDYFIPSELWRRCIEMIMKVRGDYAPEKRIDIRTDATLEELLLASKGMTPEEAKAKIADYIDVEVIKD